MMTSDDKVGGWVKKGQNHDDVILECPLSTKQNNFERTLLRATKKGKPCKTTLVWILWNRMQQRQWWHAGNLASTMGVLSAKNLQWLP